MGGHRVTRAPRCGPLGGEPTAPAVPVLDPPYLRTSARMRAGTHRVRRARQFVDEVLRRIDAHSAEDDVAVLAARARAHPAS